MYYIKNIAKTYESKHLLNYKLKLFYNYNKLFGQKKSTIIDVVNGIVIKNYSFYSTHLSYHMIPFNPEHIDYTDDDDDDDDDDIDTEHYNNTSNNNSNNNQSQSQIS